MMFDLLSKDTIKWEFSFRHGLHGFHRDFSFLLCLCHPVVEGSHVAHTQYNMRCLDKLDMTDTIRLRKSV